MRAARIPGFLAAAALAATILLACAREEPPPPPVERFVIAQSPAFSAALNVVGEAQGIFASHRLEIEFIDSSSGIASVNLLLEGKADVASSTVYPVIAADFDADELRIIATSTISGNDNRVVVRTDRGIASMADLAGRRVGTLAGGIPEYVLDLMLLEAGVPKASLEIERGDLPSVFAKFADGSLDAICCFGAWVDRALAAFPGATVALGDDQLLRIATTSVATRDSIGRRRDAFLRLVKAYIEAEAWMEAHPDEALALLVERFKLNPVATAAVWKPGLFGVRIDQSMVRDMENLALWMMEEGPKKGESMPDVLDYFAFDLLESIDPKRFTVIH